MARAWTIAKLFRVTSEVLETKTMLRGHAHDPQRKRAQADAHTDVQFSVA